VQSHARRRSVSRRGVRPISQHVIGRWQSLVAKTLASSGTISWDAVANSVKMFGFVPVSEEAVEIMMANARSRQLQSIFTESRMAMRENAIVAVAGQQSASAPAMRADIHAAPQMVMQEGQARQPAPRFRRAMNTKMSHAASAEKLPRINGAQELIPRHKHIGPEANDPCDLVGARLRLEWQREHLRRQWLVEERLKQMSLSRARLFTPLGRSSSSPLLRPASSAGLGVSPLLPSPPPTRKVLPDELPANATWRLLVASGKCASRR
jgi:hypothetical protein